MFCSECGKEIKEGAKYCYNCGTKIEYEITEEPVKEEITREIIEEPASIVPAEEPAPVVPAEEPQIMEPAIEPQIIEPAAKTEEVCENPKQNKGKGLGVWAVVLSALALVFAATCCLAPLGVLLGIAGFIMGIIASKREITKTLGIVALILGIASVILSMIIMTMVTGSVSTMDPSSLEQFYEEFYKEFEAYNDFYY